MKINLLNIGCFKNRVDSERLMRVFDLAGYKVHYGELDNSADLGIINTCGFIEESDEESLIAIKRYAKYKRNGKIKKLWIMGCYSEKIGQNLRTLIPEVDMIFGNFNWENIPKALGLGLTIDMKRHLTTPSHYAFVKISEGCSQPCSYCIKPILNGPLKSVPMEEIVAECHWLVSQGVKEIQLVAQNLTAYGIDLYGRKCIAELVSKISDIPGIEWIRLHYCYPTGFPKDLLEVISNRENVCKYLDMAIQHSETRILRLMKRGMTKEGLSTLIDNIRTAVPDIYLRTTIMVGHPGETKEDYQRLLDFLEEKRFERLGVFRYSHQNGSYASNHYIDDITIEIKNKRAKTIMEFQNRIYQQMNKKLIGHHEKVIIDQFHNGVYIARSQHSTPMADPYIIVKSNTSLKLGEFYNVIYTGFSKNNMEATYE